MPLSAAHLFPLIYLSVPPLFMSRQRQFVSFWAGFCPCPLILPQTDQYWLYIYTDIVVAQLNTHPIPFLALTKYTVSTSCQVITLVVAVVDTATIGHNQKMTSQKSTNIKAEEGSWSVRKSLKSVGYKMGMEKCRRKGSKRLKKKRV